MDKLIGNRISQARNLRNLTQENLSELTGLSVSAISRIETGHNSTSLKTLSKICNVLDITLGQLLGIDETQFDEEDLALIRAYKQNPSMQAAVRRLLGLD